MISKDNAEHYSWGDDCDGWYLVNRQDMLIIHEKMPPGTHEKRHFHSVSQMKALIPRKWNLSLKSLSLSRFCKRPLLAQRRRL